MTADTPSFGSGNLPAPRNETAITAAAAQAQASVQARYVMALQRPRDLADVRVRVLRECKRPGFAEVALYAKPIGRDRITGPSIRFAEAILRCLTNILVETQTIYDDPEKRIVRISVTDLEANLTYPTDKVVEKTVERKKPKEGAEILGERLNSYGDKVFIVRATEDDLLVKEAAIVSKAIRTNGLRMVPGDILDEAIATINATLANADATDPEAEKKKVVDAFAAQGVMPSDLKAYLGHDVTSCTPAEIADLRIVFRSLKDGESSWAEHLEQRMEERKAGNGNGAQDAADRSSLIASLARARLGDPEGFAAAISGAGVAQGVRMETLSVEVLRTISGKLRKDELGAGATAQPAAPPADDKAILCAQLSAFRLSRGAELSAALEAHGLRPDVDLGKVDVAMLQDVYGRMAKKGGAS